MRLCLRVAILKLIHLGTQTNFVVGDRVIAYRGNLKNAFGVIETIREDGTVVLRVENQELRVRELEKV